MLEMIIQPRKIPTRECYSMNIMNKSDGSAGQSIRYARSIITDNNGEEKNP